MARAAPRRRSSGRAARCAQTELAEFVRPRSIGALAAVGAVTRTVQRALLISEAGAGSTSSAAPSSRRSATTRAATP